MGDITILTWVGVLRDVIVLAGADFVRAHIETFAETLTQSEAANRLRPEHGVGGTFQQFLILL